MSNKWICLGLDRYSPSIYKFKFMGHRSKTTFTKGNKAAVKLKDDEVKLEAYRDYCAHLAAGKSKEGWYFKDKKRLLCTFKTMEKYIEEEPAVFPAINKQLAECESFSTWEERGMKMMTGEAKAETALYQMFMRNKFGWDKKPDTKPPVNNDADETIVEDCEGASQAQAKRPHVAHESPILHQKRPREESPVSTELGTEDSTFRLPPV